MSAPKLDARGYRILSGEPPKPGDAVSVQDRADCAREIRAIVAASHLEARERGRINALLDRIVGEEQVSK